LSGSHRQYAESGNIDFALNVRGDFVHGVGYKSLKISACLFKDFAALG